MIEPARADAIACVVPAAGLAMRMRRGAGNRSAADLVTPKPLLDLHGKPLVRHVVDSALEVCDRCIVVTGYRGEEVAAALHGALRVDIVACPDYERGMIFSIRTGARKVRTPWFFVAPADMPGLTPEIFRAVRDARASVPESCRSIFPEARGRRGHPVLISREVVPEMDRIETSQSMKSFLLAWPCGTAAVESTGILLDVDTPEMLEALRGETEGLSEDTGREGYV